MKKILLVIQGGGRPQIDRTALATFSCFDSGNRPSEASEPERFYHGFAFEGKKVLIG